MCDGEKRGRNGGGVELKWEMVGMIVDVWGDFRRELWEGKVSLGKVDWFGREGACVSWSNRGGFMM